MVASLIFGGGTQTGHLSDAILQLLCVPLLLFALWRMDWAQFKRLRLPFLFCCAVIAVALLQLVLLPPALWAALPNRVEMASDLALADAGLHWRPLSIAPHATWLSLASLIVPISVFFSVVQLDHRQQKRLILILLVIGILSVFLGLLQLSQGPGSLLRFFAVTNRDDAVGFFANRNHFAALLYCLIPFGAAWIAQAAARPEYSPPVRGLPMRLAGVAVVAIFVAAQAMTRSRTGLTLSTVALVTAFLLVSTERKERRYIAAILTLGILGGAVLLSTTGVFPRLLERISTHPLDDARLTIFETTLQAIAAYMPSGSGIGTFAIVYGAFERPEYAMPVYINRAHSDVLELALETGAAGLILLALFVLWLTTRTIRVWRSPARHSCGASIIARAASLAAWLLIAHSFIDYPLRTAALMAVFAFSCAVLVAPGDKKSALA